MSDQILTPLQFETFSEVVNIAVGKAAETLSMMIERKILIDVPKIELLNQTQLVARFEECFGKQALAVSIGYQGLLSGKATLFFEATEGKNLVDQLLAVNADDDWDDWDDDEPSGSEYGFTDSDKEAIIEVGNLMINALLGSVGNLVGGQMHYSPPALTMDFIFHEEFSSAQQDSQAFLIEAVFQEQETKIKGLLSIHFELGDFLGSFLTQLDQLHESFSSDDDQF